MADEQQLVLALRGGDEAAFVALVTRYQGPMLNVAMAYVADRSVAEEVVQEAWLAVLRGIRGFEGRSQLKTWIMRILVNSAKRRRARDARAIVTTELAEAEPAVDPSRFRGPTDAWPGHWVTAPNSWSEMPEVRLLSREMLDHVREAIEVLPDVQREVITLRDVIGLSASEVCNALEISDSNQRVLLHRARSKVRAAVERYMDQGR